MAIDTSDSILLNYQYNGESSRRPPPPSGGRAAEGGPVGVAAGSRTGANRRPGIGGERRRAGSGGDGKGWLDRRRGFGEEDRSELRREGGGGPEVPQVRRFNRSDCELPAAWWVEGEGVIIWGRAALGGARPPEAHPSPQPSTVHHFFSSISGSEGQSCGLRLIQEIFSLQDGVRRAAVLHADDLGHLKAQKPKNLGEVVGGLL